MTGNVPDDPESACGLQVATIQVAKTMGAGFGGYAFEVGRAPAPVMAAGLLLGITSLVVLAGVRSRPTRGMAAGS